MKKPDYSRVLFLTRKRDKKRLKRLKKKSTYKGELSVFEKELKLRINIDHRIIKKFKSPLYSYLFDSGFITGTEDRWAKIIIDEIFCLYKNYDKTIETIKNIIYTIWMNLGKEIELDFSRCTSIDQSALFLLQIIRLELITDFKKLDRRLHVLKSMPDFKFIKSKDQVVNLNLFLCGYLNNISLEKEIVPIHTLGYLKGSKSQKHYLENRKGIMATKVVRYLDNCLTENDYCFTAKGKNELGNMIGEILNNAEDHSPLSTYYITANYYMLKSSTDQQSNIGILNLSFMNFGYSIYEGLEQTKMENKDVYETLDDNYAKLSKKGFTKENLFTLYALQDGISRLKFEDESRGTGTMTFIKCFYEIGDYENNEKKLAPQLSILSGNTHLICNNKYRPQMADNGNFFLPLNSDNDLSKPPDVDNLISLKYKFPGTMLSVKFCLNREHIEKKINGKVNT